VAVQLFIVTTDAAVVLLLLVHLPTVASGIGRQCGTEPTDG